MRSQDRGGTVRSVLTKFIIGLAALLVVLAFPSLSSAGEKPEWEHDGWLDLRYRLRFTDEGKDPFTDQDIYTSLFFDAKKKDVMGLQFYGRLAWDVDGHPSRNIFSSAEDTWDSRAHAYLYTAFADLYKLGPVKRVRIGRQQIYEDVHVHFDGLRVDSEKFGPVQLSLYGGIPVHLYESSMEGDWMIGTKIEIKPAKTTRVAFDYVHIRDNRKHDFNQDDDLFQLSLTQGIAKTGRIYFRYSTIDGRGSQFELKGSYLYEPEDLTVRANALFQVGSYRDFSIEFSPYYLLLDRYEDFYQLGLNATKGLFDHFEVDVGVTVRELMHDTKGGPLNHEWQRYYMTLACFDIPIKGFEASITGGAYHTTKDWWADFGLDFTQRINKSFKASVGTYWSIYKFDPYYSLDEREDVRTIYCKFDWKILENVRLKSEFNVERDEEELYFELDTHLKLSF